MIAAFGTWGGWPALIAVGTVIAAVALQLVLWWREKQRRPELTLAFDDHKKAEEKYQPTDPLATFLRLAVSNAPGKETARDVEIIVLEIEEFAISPAGSGGRSIWLANPALGMDTRVRLGVAIPVAANVDPTRSDPIRGRGALASARRRKRRPELRLERDSGACDS